AGLADGQHRRRLAREARRRQGRLPVPLARLRAGPAGKGGAREGEQGRTRPSTHGIILSATRLPPAGAPFRLARPSGGPTAFRPRLTTGLALSSDVSRPSGAHSREKPSTQR